MCEFSDIRHYEAQNGHRMFVVSKIIKLLLHLTVAWFSDKKKKIKKS